MLVAHNLTMSSASSNPAPVSYTLTVATPSIKTSKTPTRVQRPSLTEQLKAISHSAYSITTQLRTSYQLDTSLTRSLQQQSGGFSSFPVHPADCLLEATTVHLTVGRLDCRFPCPVQFAADRCSYLFQHPFEPKEIQMIMYYRDMRQTQLSIHERSLRFRIDRTLQQFGDDYRPSNPHHVLKLVFATASEVLRVKQFLAKWKISMGINSQHDTNDNVA